MIDFNTIKVDIQIDINEIKSKITDLDIFHKYCKNFVEIDKPFTSDLYIDNKPSVRIYLSSYGYKYKDHGSGLFCDCYNYVMIKYRCTYPEALKIIATDFNIKKLQSRYSPELLLGNEPKKVTSNVKVKTIIEIEPQSWNLVDYEYWSKYNISFELLNEYNVQSLKSYTIYKGNNRYKILSTKKSPIYSYAFAREGEIKYKVYRPMEVGQGKWMFNGNALDLEGADNLPLFDELLIITKSLKDCMVLNILNYSAIALQGEKNKLDIDTYNKYTKRFNRIISLYDNDSTGEEGAKYLENTYNIDKIFIPKDSECKDISDYIIKYKLEKSKQLIDKLCMKQ